MEVDELKDSNGKNVEGAVEGEVSNADTPGLVEVIAGYIEACREGSDTPQLFDVLAKDIREKFTELEEEKEDDGDDLSEALDLLESSMKLLWFLSDSRLVDKLLKRDRARAGDLAKEILEFINQWPAGGTETV